MRRRLRSNNTNFLKLAMVGIVAMAGGFLLTSFLGSKSETQALSATEFQPGRIIDDSIFYNPNTMTAAEIDAFIDSHNPACDMWGTQKVYGNVTRAEYVKQLRAGGNTKFHDPPFVCISEYYENPETHKTNFSTGGKKEEGMLSAGEIIYQAAHEYNVNPQVLLVMLKKESYVWGDDWPHSFQYNTVMGYACPDGAPCDTKYFGFYNQVMMAAWQLNYYREHIYSYNYRPYATNNILYNPDRSCGSKSVYLENIATTSLYIYTPYVPNDGALANYPGTSYCGSYGNRNFYMYFREWFGSTLETPKDEEYFPDDEYYIVPAATPNKSIQLDVNNDANGADYYIRERSADTTIYGKFKFEKQNDGSYVITNSGSSKAIDVHGGTFTPNTTISQWESHKGVSQRFRIINNKDGSFSLATSFNTNLAIDCDTEGGCSLQWLTGTDGQKFRFVSTNASKLTGKHRLVSSLDTNFAVDVYGGKITKNGANINLWEQNYSEGQVFNFVYNKNTGYYRIQPSYSTDYSVDVNGGGNTKNTNISLWANNDGCAQKWDVVFFSDGSISLLSGCSGLAFDLHGGAAKNGANISTWNYEANIAQKWLPLDPVTTNNEDYSNTYSFSNSAIQKFNFNSQSYSKIALEKDTATSLYRIRLPNSDLYIAAYSTNTTKLLTEKKSTYYNQLWELTRSDSGYRLANAGSTNSLSINTANKLILSSTKTSATEWTLTPVKSQETTGYTGEGLYRLHSALDLSYYVGIVNDDGQKGKNIVLTKEENATKFYIKKLSNSKYILEDSTRKRKLDVEGGRSYNGANIGAWDDNGGACNQRWFLESRGNHAYQIKESCQMRSLEIYGGILKEGQNIGVWDSHSGLNQVWALEHINN